MCVDSENPRVKDDHFLVSEGHFSHINSNVKEGKGLISNYWTWMDWKNIFFSSEVYLLVALAKALKVAPQSGPGQVWRAVFSIYLSLIYYATVC